MSNSIPGMTIYEEEYLRRTLVELDTPLVEIDPIETIKLANEMYAHKEVYSLYDRDGGFNITVRGDGTFDNPLKIIDLPQGVTINMATKLLQNYAKTKSNNLFVVFYVDGGYSGIRCAPHYIGIISPSGELYFSGDIRLENNQLQLMPIISTEEA